jgi:hypothetical protein
MTKILFFRKKLSKVGFFCQRAILKSYEEYKERKTKVLFPNYLGNNFRLDTSRFIKTINHPQIQIISFRH